MATDRLPGASSCVRGDDPSDSDEESRFNSSPSLRKDDGGTLRKQQQIPNGARNFHVGEDDGGGLIWSNLGTRFFVSGSHSPLVTRVVLCVSLTIAGNQADVVSRDWVSYATVRRREGNPGRVSAFDGTHCQKGGAGGPMVQMVYLLVA